MSRSGFLPLDHCYNPRSTVTSIVLPYSFPVLVRRSARHARVILEAKLEAVKRVFCSLFYDRSLLRVYLTVQMNALVSLSLLSRGPFSPLAVLTALVLSCSCPSQSPYTVTHASLYNISHSHACESPIRLIDTSRVLCVLKISSVFRVGRGWSYVTIRRCSVLSSVAVEVLVVSSRSFFGSAIFIRSLPQCKRSFRRTALSTGASKSLTNDDSKKLFD